MQEDIEHRAVTITVSAGRLTGRVLAKALAAALRQIRQVRKSAKTLHGKQSVKKLMNYNVATNSITITGNTRLFDRVARKFNVDYAFYKTGPKEYQLFFKAGQADAITACFAEYTKRAIKKERRLPIREQVRRAAKIARSRPQERVRSREAAHDDR